MRSVRGRTPMIAIDLKSAVVMFPWEDSVRTICFRPMDDSAVIVLTSLIEDKGARVFALDGFSVEEMEFLSSFCSLEQCISNTD